jgi:hypothetical protein
MAVTNADWAVRNSSRKYPLDDTASTVSDRGVFLPESFLVDCNIWAPEVEFSGGRTLKYLYIGSAAVTENYVSLTILGTAGAAQPVDGDPVGQQETPFIPLASFGISKQDLVPYKNYPVSPNYDGVSGWIMFGQLVDAEPFNLLFSTPQQSMVAPRVARFYSGLPTPGVTLGALRNLLVGDVELVTDTPITAEIVERTVEGVGTRNVIEIKMADEEGGLPDKDTMEGFAGKCSPRPESGTCNKQPITRVTGVSPDEYGRIFVDIEGITTRVFEDGVCVDSSQGLSDACAGNSITPTSVCRLAVPYTNTFDSEDDIYDFDVDAGYFYIASGNLYGFSGGYDSAACGTCLTTLGISTSVRSFTLNISDDGGADVGQFFCDSGDYRVVVLLDGSTFVEQKSTGDRTSLGTAPVSNPMTVLVSSTGSIAGITIPTDYWKPTGGTGIIVYGESEAVFSQYGVIDV